MEYYSFQISLILSYIFLVLNNRLHTDNIKTLTDRKSCPAGHRLSFRASYLRLPTKRKKNWSVRSSELFITLDNISDIVTFFVSQEEKKRASPSNCYSIIVVSSFLSVSLTADSSHSASVLLLVPAEFLPWFIIHIV